MIYKSYIGTKLNNISTSGEGRTFPKFATIPIQNGASGISISDFSFDGVINPSIEVYCQAFRRSDTEQMHTYFQLYLRFDGSNWKIDRHSDYLADGLMDGLSFSVTTVGTNSSVKYDSSTLAGGYIQPDSNIYAFIVPGWGPGISPTGINSKAIFERMQKQYWENLQKFEVSPENIEREGKFMFNQNGGPFNSDFSKIKKIQKQFLKKWESVKGPIDELVKLKEEGKGFNEVLNKLENEISEIKKNQDQFFQEWQSMKGTIENLTKRRKKWLGIF
jgi:hypothetical protein